MRLLKKFEKEKLARKFSYFLKKEEIECSIEMNMEGDRFSYDLWIHDEDKIEIAQRYLEEFEKDPENPKYNIILFSENPIEIKEPRKKIETRTFLTSLTLFLCIFVYIINLYQEIDIRKKNPRVSYVLLTPIQNLLLFDVPKVLIEVDEVLRKYNIDPTKDDILKQFPLAQIELEKIDKKPFWRGFYDELILKNVSVSMKGTFEKIKEGEIWRVFTPCILHKDFLHLLFNMLWLWLLGKQIEARLSKLKYLLLIVIIGVLSNVAQYLMSGPYFLGYSGIIMGFVGFIWSREKVAPWEGYPLQKTVFFFLGVYVVLMFVLSFFSFVTQIIGLNLFTPNIANTAHIVGAAIGFILGRLSFFSWSPMHER